MQRRQINIQRQSRSGAASSDDMSRPSTAMGTWPQNPNQGHGLDSSGIPSNALHYGYVHQTIAYSYFFKT
jgi:hypothetical protein